jgi:LacI family transcriptional regulator
MSIGIRDIAQALNLSKATVSRALSDHPDLKEETKKRVLDKAKEMGMSPIISQKRSLQNKHIRSVSYCLMFVIPFLQRL